MLYIVATPVGNLDDMTPRAVATLKRVHGIACEDTRRTRILLTHFQILRPPVLLSYRQGNEERVGQQVLGMLREGRDIALCSDGGYPGLSDPGYRLIRLAVEAGVEVDVIPGASAIPLALLHSGLSTSSYTFKGYPPRKPGAKARFFEEDRDRPHTLVVFESPFRVRDTLQTALDVLGDRQAAVCIELTKKFQRVTRGFLAELVRAFADVTPRGEIAIVIAGNNPKFAREDESDGDEPGQDGPEIAPNVASVASQVRLPAPAPQ